MAAHPHKRWLWRLLWLGCALALLGGLVELLIHHYDPTRVIYKRFKAADRYVYDEVAPNLLATDPVSLIARDVVADPAAARHRLAKVIWGEAGLPRDLLPRMLETNAAVPLLGELGDEVRVDRLQVDTGPGLWSLAFLMHAAEPNNRLVIYHHGFGDPIDRAAPLFRALLAAGYDVIAFNMLGDYGNPGLARPDPDNPELANLTAETSRFDRPLRYHIDPVVAAANLAETEGGYRSVDMIGLSMGGFMTILAAAVDARIERSYPVAGDLPLYLRRGQEVLLDFPPYHEPLIAAFSHPDLYVLGASGAGRGQLQVFNRYDRCCYEGPRGKVYEAAVAEAVAATPEGGRFAVALDETHADHRISAFTFRLILDDLARGR